VVTVRPFLGCLVLAAALPCAAQEGDFGISVPVTAGASAMYTQRLQLANPSASPVTAGFRVVVSPTLRLGKHWFVYAALQERLWPYFYYDAYNPEHELYADVLQAFVGYSVRTANASLVFKAGQLSSAFGSFPLRYDDAQNPLIDQPLSYITEIPLRADQLPCGTRDVLRQYYGYVADSCGGAKGWGSGLTSATMYALPGVQVEASIGRIDLRLQATDGSPANPQGWTSPRNYVQWAGGGGYTIRQGFRVGISGFRGPYLDESLESLLPAGKGIRSFPASAVGLDAQWARGRFSLNGEWQHFWFAEPGFMESPTVTSGYGELKAILTPRLYLAGRAGWLSSGAIVDDQGVSAAHFAPWVSNVESGIGVWLNRRQLLKASYSWLHNQGQATHRYDVVGLEFVTTFNALNRAFR
jgi:hypothetical protein